MPVEAGGRTKSPSFRGRSSCRTRSASANDSPRHSTTPATRPQQQYGTALVPVMAARTEAVDQITEQIFPRTARVACPTGRRAGLAGRPIGRRRRHAARRIGHDRRVTGWECPPCGRHFARVAPEPRVRAGDDARRVLLDRSPARAPGVRRRASDSCARWGRSSSSPSRWASSSRRRAASSSCDR